MSLLTNAVVSIGWSPWKRDKAARRVRYLSRVRCVHGLSGMFGSYVRLGALRVVLKGGPDSSKIQRADMAVAFVVPLGCATPGIKRNLL